MMRRLIVSCALATLATLGAAHVASAHPLGNFSVNHLIELRVSSDRIDALYILDQAEIPTFQERGLSNAEILQRKRAEIGRNVALTVDGRHVPLRPAAAGRLSFPPGQGGLALTRLELPLAARVADPKQVVLHDGTFADRVGWKAILARPGDGTAVRSSVPSEDPTNGLRRYPKGALDSPVDERTATLDAKPGNGTLTAPELSSSARATTTDRSGDGFAGVFSDAASGDGVLVLLLLAAFGWGAVHALSPGHGKGMVAAYLIGTRGTARHAVALGATVTFTHTIGVFSLGLVTLLLSQYILPEDLYPWLNLAAGLLVVGVGLGVLRARVRRARRDRHHHHHDNDHDHAHHHVPDRVTWKGLVGMGVAAGLIPCPSALVVLLGAIAQHQVALGLLLIVAFSFGLAMTLTALGLAVVFARRLTLRLRVPSRLVAVLPAASALFIVVVGFVLTAQAIPQLA
jgi:ABC-type nickel/cobalt efflux system permease component RcnA